jgi:hypothetical protein
MRARATLVLLLVSMVVGGCGITRVDSPVTFSSDRRLDITDPSAEAKATLPVQVRWEAKDFALTDGQHFGVFVDRVPIGPKRSVRLRICTEGEKLPPQIGAFRKVCKDDRKTVFFTSKPSITLACFEPRFNVPKRTRNTHTVSVVLLDGNDRRVGEAVDSVKFEVDAAQAKRCRGL